MCIHIVVNKPVIIYFFYHILTHRTFYTFVFSSYNITRNKDSLRLTTYIDYYRRVCTASSYNSYIVVSLSQYCVLTQKTTMQINITAPLYYIVIYSLKSTLLNLYHIIIHSVCTQMEIISNTVIL